MKSDIASVSERFPRSAKYNPDWIIASISGSGHPLWLSEWLSTAMDLRAGMRVLDIGCGRAVSSIFLCREFGVEVWAIDLWFSASENLRRIREAGVEEGVFPIHANACSLPFAAEFFDAIVCIDAFPYFGTDDLYLNYLARFVKPGGSIGIAGAGFMQEIGAQIPDHLREWWTEDIWCLHSADWWRRHWERTGIVDVTASDTMPDGWRLWLDWHKVIAPDNRSEIEALEADQGRYLGYFRLVGWRLDSTTLVEPIESISTTHTKVPLLRNPE